jgi:hypothetical protein
VFDLAERKRHWLDHLAANGVPAEALDELETHLDETVAELAGKGLNDEEAFLVAAHRLGPVQAVGREYVKVHGGSDRRRLTGCLAGFIGFCGIYTAAGMSPALDAARLLGDGPNDEAAFALLILAYTVPFLAAALVVGVVRFLCDRTREAVASYRAGGIRRLVGGWVSWIVTAVVAVVTFALALLMVLGLPAKALPVAIGVSILPLLFLVAGGVGLVRIAGDLGRGLSAAGASDRSGHAVDPIAD